jgi:hypothetical protein
MAMAAAARPKVGRIRPAPLVPVAEGADEAPEPETPEVAEVLPLEVEVALGAVPSVGTPRVPLTVEVAGTDELSAPTWTVKKVEPTMGPRLDWLTYCW